MGKQTVRSNKMYGFVKLLSPKVNGSTIKRSKEGR